MANSVTPEYLSQSTGGAGVVVAATASPGTLIHTATSAANTKDEVYMYATNLDGSNLTLNLEIGGTGDAFRRAVVIPFQAGLVPIYLGIRIGGGTTIRAYTPNGANMIIIDGNVNRVVTT